MTSMSMNTILIVDDERLIRWSLSTDLSQNGYRVYAAASCAEAREMAAENRPDLILLDIKLPDGDGLDLLKGFREDYPETLVIIITAHGMVETVVEAMKLGAYDFFAKPFQVDEVRHRIAKALETGQLRREVDRLRHQQKEEWGIDKIIGQSPPIKKVMELVKKIAGSDATTILVQGESGTGKDLIVRAIHDGSRRRDKPFMAVNCSAVPGTLLESELFGHEKGAFTDARQTKKGLFEMADGGTLLLDEIGTMKFDLQAKLLRVLESKTFKRVGGTADIEVDVRIVAATNMNIEEQKEMGFFRPDLFYRLNVVPITLPPLRDRGRDILLLAKCFLDSYNRQFRKKIRGFTPRAEEKLLSYSWPGNVRELKNIVERIVLLESTDIIGPDQIPIGAGRPASNPSRRYLEPDVTMEEIEKRVLLEALETAGGNQSRAARLLGLGRDALRYRLKKFGLGDLDQHLG